ncbi:MAG TPA: hypothetical protein VMC85_01065 [Desulfomonilaceae bacterium]|nr:hypothetical protein [Desulfomonilaceae bacterium]
MQIRRSSKLALLIFRTIFYLCAAYFFLMGIFMMVFPGLVTKNAGVQHPMILGIVRGIGGSIIGSTIFYIAIALKPIERRWAALIIAFANILAIILDFASVYLGEYSMAHAMIDVPIETVSFLTIVAFYSASRDRNTQ